MHDAAWAVLDSVVSESRARDLLIVSCTTAPPDNTLYAVQNTHVKPPLILNKCKKT